MILTTGKAAPGTSQPAHAAVRVIGSSLAHGVTVAAPLIDLRNRRDEMLIRSDAENDLLMPNRSLRAGIPSDGHARLVAPDDRNEHRRQQR